MQDIPESSLDNLESRIAYLRSFLEFTTEDASALHAAKPVLAPLLPSVVDLVYTKLLKYSITSKAFVPRQSGYEGETIAYASDLNLEHLQIMFRKDFLKGYIVKLVSMAYEDFSSLVPAEEACIESQVCSLRDSVSPGIGYVENIIITTVIKHPDLSTETKLSVCTAVNKIIWIQNDLFARHYIEEKTSA